MNAPTLTGLAACVGVAEGVVRIADSHGKCPVFEEGDILVAKVTEPSMVMMMNKAAAFVTDLGGITSHAALIAREIGVPCVVGTKNATTVLKEGMRVRVDGAVGTVHVL
jgi:pyruvate,water dikinase